MYYNSGEMLADSAVEASSEMAENMDILIAECVSALHPVFGAQYSDAFGRLIRMGVAAQHACVEAWSVLLGGTVRDQMTGDEHKERMHALYALDLFEHRSAEEVAVDQIEGYEPIKQLVAAEKELSRIPTGMSLEEIIAVGELIERGRAAAEKIFLQINGETSRR